MKRVNIQEYEGKWLIPLLEQAQRNLGSAATMGSVVLDRGYLDGSDVWQVHHKGLLVVIVGKTTMAVVQDAQGLAKDERAAVRERVISHGHGTTAQEERLRTELVGIEAFTSDESSGQTEDTQHAHRRDDTGQPIHAMVVRRWDHRVPKGGGTVDLTNGEVRDPCVIFDISEWRSVMENGMFKEGTHPWHLVRFPKRTQAVVTVHVFFPLLVLAFCPAFRLWQASTATTPTEVTQVLPALSSALLGGEGTARWRQR